MGHLSLIQWLWGMGSAILLTARLWAEQWLSGPNLLSALGAAMLVAAAALQVRRARMARKLPSSRRPSLTTAPVDGLREATGPNPAPAAPRPQPLPGRRGMFALLDEAMREGVAMRESLTSVSAAWAVSMGLRTPATEDEVTAWEQRVAAILSDRHELRAEFMMDVPPASRLRFLGPLHARMDWRIGRLERVMQRL